MKKWLAEQWKLGSWRRACAFMFGLFFVAGLVRLMLPHLTDFETVVVGLLCGISVILVEGFGEKEKP